MNNYEIFSRIFIPTWCHIACIQRTAHTLHIEKQWARKIFEILICAHEQIATATGATNKMPISYMHSPFREASNKTRWLLVLMYIFNGLLFFTIVYNFHTQTYRMRHCTLWNVHFLLISLFFFAHAMCITFRYRRREIGRNRHNDRSAYTVLSSSFLEGRYEWFLFLFRRKWLESDFLEKARDAITARIECMCVCAFVFLLFLFSSLSYRLLMLSNICVVDKVEKKRTRIHKNRGAEYKLDFNWIYRIIRWATIPITTPQKWFLFKYWNTSIYFGNLSVGYRHTRTHTTHSHMFY